MTTTTLNKTNTETQIPAKVSDSVRIAIQGGAGAFHEIASRKYQTEQPVDTAGSCLFLRWH